MRIEEDEAKRIFGGCMRRTPVSSSPIVPPGNKTTTNFSTDKVKEIAEMYKASSKDEVDGGDCTIFLWKWGSHSM
jgi:hypothetical protein